MKSSILICVCARGGSKGIPGKNLKPLGGKPLIDYTIDFINKIVPWTSIISTNSIEFLFPSIFFLVALKRFDGLKEAGSFSVTLKKAIAIFNIVLGTGLFIIHFI